MNEQAAFQAVWQRVAPGEDCPVEVNPPPPEALSDPREERALALGRLWEDWTAGAGRCRVLAGRTRWGRSALLTLAARKTAQARALAAALYILTGVRPASCPAPAPAGEVYAALREEYHREKERREALLALAAGETDPGLTALYAQLAQETRNAQKILGEVIGQLT